MVLQVGSTVFVHGGLHPDHVQVGVDNLNDMAQVPPSRTTCTCNPAALSLQCSSVYLCPVCKDYHLEPWSLLSRIELSYNSQALP